VILKFVIKGLPVQGWQADPVAPAPFIQRSPVIQPIQKPGELDGEINQGYLVKL